MGTHTRLRPKTILHSMPRSRLNGTHPNTVPNKHEADSLEPRSTNMAARPRAVARNQPRPNTWIGCVDLPELRPIYAHMQQHPSKPSTKQRGASRLLQIFITETAHLVWVMRCERAIQNKQHTEDETKARWLRAINDRLTCDRIIATKIKRDTKHTNLVKHTWGPVLQQHQVIPDDWINKREVLVGSGREY